MNRKIIKSILVAGVVVFAIIFGGCDQNGGILIPSGATELTVSVKADNNVSDANLIITEAKALITEVEFEKESNGKNELLIKGPFVMKFSLDGTLSTFGTQFIIRDIYTKVKFKLHKPEDNETVSDPEFKEGTGENQRYSFIIKGTYNGNSFVYKSKNSANIVINFAQAENINLKKANITILFNKLKWFMNGSTQLNPSDPVYESVIDDNIKNSFIEAFRDDDENGSPDP